MTEHDGHMKLTWLNIRGARSKDELLVRTATSQQWPMVLLTETKLKREREKLFCGDKNEYQWMLGSGQEATRHSAPGKGGVGALVHASIRGLVHKLDSTRDQLWLQMDAAPAVCTPPTTTAMTPDQRRPTFIGVVYLPTGTSPSAQDERARIYEEVALRVQRYQSRGPVLLGGDMNARLSANGDTVTNAAGEQLAQFAQRHGLLIGNTQLPPQSNGRSSHARCTGSFSRSELRMGVVQQSTLDYVLISKAAQARVRSLTLDESVPHRVLSDHKPLVVEWQCRTLAYSELPTAEAPRVRWRVDDICADRRAKVRMQRGMDTAMSAWCADAKAWQSSDAYAGASAESKVSTMLGSWEYQLTRSLADTIGAKQVSAHAKPWVKGGNLVELIRTRDELRAEAELTHQQRHAHPKAAPAADTAPGTHDEWNALALRALHAQREVRKEIHRRKKRQREETFSSVELEWSHPKLFFRRVHEMRSDGTYGLSAPVLQNPRTSELVNDLPSRLEVTRRHYADLGTDERDTQRRANALAPSPKPTSAEEFIEAEQDCDEFDGPFASRIEARVSEMARESPTEVDGPLDVAWTAKELAGALKRLRNGKAPGADLIHAEFLRYGGMQLERAMLILFNEILRCEYWPDRWRLGLICPIYKRAGAETELDNYRPITLLSIVSKLFEILLNTRLMEWAEANRVLCDEQGGFRTKRGCADQLFVLKEVWCSRRERKRPTFGAFLDVKSAYDRVWRTGMWHQLFMCGVRGKAWRMLRAMYEGMQRAAVVDGQRTAPFPVDVGVSQGSVLSPFLYSVFIDGLIRALQAEPHLGVDFSGEMLVGLLYADDIVILAPDPDTLQRMLDVTTAYAHQWRFHFNGRKSQVVVQGSKAEVAAAMAAPPMYRLDGHLLSVVAEYKYLGMETGLPPHSAPDQSFCARILKATTNRAHDILLAGCEMNELDARCSSRLWHALCRPILEYGSEVWLPNVGQAKRIEQTQAWFARRVLGCHQGTPAVFATSELGMRSLRHRREQYHMRYWYRLCAAVPDRLLHRVFRQRVCDVKRSAADTRRSLCRMLLETLTKYGLEDEWDTACTDQTYESDEWAAKVDRAVRDEEARARLIALTLRPSLDTYAAALAPALGRVAPYIWHSRNREGAWIQCRLRSQTLPLMAVLSRQCRPAREDVHSTCPVCPQPSGPDQSAASADATGLAPVMDVDSEAPPRPAEVESVTHFVSSCRSVDSVHLRRDLCRRLRGTVSQWQTRQRAAWCAAWKGPLPLAGPNDPTLLERSLKAEPTNGVQFITAVINAMASRWDDLDLTADRVTPPTHDGAEAEAASAQPARADVDRRWCELILGRLVDPLTGVAWDETLLSSIQRETQNFLLLLWRARAARLGGVPTLLTRGRGITMEPYARMKTIGVRSVSRPTTKGRQDGQHVHAPTSPIRSGALRLADRTLPPLRAHASAVTHVDGAGNIASI
jgi:exonuclease III